jgi:uncharacterized protein
VGINHLTLSAVASFRASTAAGLDATWSDSLLVKGDGDIKVKPEGYAIALELHKFPGHQFFTSVAFKYQSIESRPDLAAVNSARLGLLPTTSGSATGVAAETSKLESMSSALVQLGAEEVILLPGAASHQPITSLGVASGVTPENVHEVMDHVSHILVSTGISIDDDSDRFDYEKLARLVGKLRAAQSGD